MIIILAIGVIISLIAARAIWVTWKIEEAEMNRMADYDF